MTVTRSTLLVLTGVGVGLLTLTYVLGVQVGKQSAALRKASPTGAGEELKALPIPLHEQLRQLEGMGLQRTAPAPLPSAPAPAPAQPVPTPAPPPAVPEARSAEAKGWTVQLLSTTDKEEAKRVAARASAAGFAARLVDEKGSTKVRLSRGGSKEQADAQAERLKARGFKAFPVKLD